MLERMQYVLVVLLFVLAGSLNGASLQGGTNAVQPDMLRKSTLQAPVPARNFLAAAVISCNASIETPGQSLDHKDITRPRSGAHATSAQTVVFRSSVHAGGCVLHPRPVDYYIFSLGRILI